MDRLNSRRFASGGFAATAAAATSPAPAAAASRQVIVHADTPTARDIARAVVKGMREDDALRPTFGP